MLLHRYVLFIIIVLFLGPLSVLAKGLSFVEGTYPLIEKEMGNSILLAQFEGDDTYDPFADYSEFEEAADEEADVNFFRNGRFVNVGFLGGHRSLTSNLGKLYSSSAMYGLFLSYFFDLRFAMQVSFQTGDHRFNIVSGSNNVVGNVSMSANSFHLKYYFNTQNVTRGLADLNPYFIGGFSQFARTFTLLDEESFSRDGAVGIDMGAGIEIPMLRNKMYFGAQAMYHLVSFPNENTEIVLSDGTHTGIFPTGDVITILGVLGINF